MGNLLAYFDGLVLEYLKFHTQMADLKINFPKNILVEILFFRNFQFSGKIIQFLFLNFN